jgi:hypothetical protein
MEAQRFPSGERGVSDDSSAAAQEQTFALMALRHRHSAWWASMAPYWASLPAPGQALREQSFPDDLLALLQDEALVCT